MSSRYYESLNSDGNEIRPGKISAELREALNIPSNDIPIWIYRMRALGYPPGWLKKAIVDTNDIFDTEDNDTNDQGSGKRKGPADDKPIQYDHSKLIEYPGFNAPMPEGCIDYHYFANMPAMLEHQQLEYAKKHMNSYISLPMPKRVRTSDPELNVSNDVSRTEDPLEDPKSPEPECIEISSSEESDEEPDPVPASAPQANGLNTSKAEEIKLVSKGSPMPKPVQRAPLEKFSEGVVGELLYFENIPSSTGKFESIRGLLNSIRKSKKDTDTSFESTKSEP